jgi:hypothetical protein
LELQVVDNMVDRRRGFPGTASREKNGSLGEYDVAPDLEPNPLAAEKHQVVGARVF